MNGGNDIEVVATSDTIKRKFITREVFAISTGDSLYLNCLRLDLQHWYTPAELSGDSLIFRAGIPQTERAVTNGAFMFGAAGGAVYGAVDGMHTAMLRYSYSMQLESGRVTLLHR